MLNLFDLLDLFGYKLEMTDFAAVAAAAAAAAALTVYLVQILDYHLRMDCILLKHLFLVRFGLHSSQLDPFATQRKTKKTYQNTHYHITSFAN